MKNILLVLVLIHGIFKTQIMVGNDNSKDIHFTVAINMKFPDNSSDALHIEDFDSAYNDQVILKLPKTYSENGKPTRLVYCAHGAGGGVPVKIWHGTGDKVVNVSYSRNFQKYIKNANGYCELRELNSNDHGLSCGSPYMNREIVLFFKRFDE